MSFLIARDAAPPEGTHRPVGAPPVGATKGGAAALGRRPRSGGRNKRATDLDAWIAGTTLDVLLRDPRQREQELRAAVADAPQTQLLAAISNPEAFQRLRGLGIDLLSLPRFARDGHALAYALMHDHFVVWVATQPSGAVRVLQSLSIAGGSEGIEAVTLSARWPVFARAVLGASSQGLVPPRGIAVASQDQPPLSAADRQRLLRPLFDRTNSPKARALVFALAFPKVGAEAITGYDAESQASVWDAMRAPGASQTGPQAVTEWREFVADRAAHRSLADVLADPRADEQQQRAAVRGASGTNLRHALTDSGALARMSKLGVSILDLPAIARDGQTLAAALAHPMVVRSALSAPGGAARLVTLVAESRTPEAADELGSTSAWTEVLRQLVPRKRRTGSESDVGVAASPLWGSLRAAFDLASDPVARLRFIEARFGVSFGAPGGLSEAKDDAPLDVVVLPALWDSLERLPAAHVRGNRSLSGFRQMGRGAPHAGDYAPDSGIVRLARSGVTGGPGGAVAAADARTNMRTVSKADNTSIVASHEVGHAVAREFGIDTYTPGSPFADGRGFGRWRKHTRSELPRLIAERADEEEEAEIGGTLEDWRFDPPILDGRAFSCVGDIFWSYDASVREGWHVSDYALASPTEFFAEVYATFYLTAPQEPGRLIRAWNRDVYEWFVRHVHRGVARAQPPAAAAGQPGR